MHTAHAPQTEHRDAGAEKIVIEVEMMLLINLQLALRPFEGGPPRLRRVGSVRRAESRRKTCGVASPRWVALRRPPPPQSRPHPSTTTPPRWRRLRAARGLGNRRPRGRGRCVARSRLRGPPRKLQCVVGQGAVQRHAKCNSRSGRHTRQHAAPLARRAAAAPPGRTVHLASTDARQTSQRTPALRRRRTAARRRGRGRRWRARSETWRATRHTAGADEPRIRGR